MLAVLIVALYVWGQHLSTNVSLASTLYISPITVALAVLVAVAAVVCYFWTPKDKLIPFSASLYGLLVITTGLLVAQSGGVGSPFVAVWMAVSVFAGLYGVYGLAGITVAVNLYIAYSLFSGQIIRTDIIVAAIAGNLPMFVSYILWHGRETIEEAHDQSMTKLNKSLEQESTKSDAIIQAIGDGVMVVSQTGEVLVINPAAQQMTGWSADDGLHLHFESLLKLQNADGTPIESGTNPISRVLNVGQQVRENELCLITKSGKKVYVAFVVSPMGQGDGAIAVFRDITKERDDEKAQAEFISTASHEMRTPVASIEGYLGLALNPNTATIDEKARDFITKAHTSAQHLGHLFQDLLDVTKADDGRLKETPAVIDVVAFTRDIVGGLQTKASDKNLELIYKPDGSKTTTGTTVISPVLFAHVDKDHLREVLDNLVENAIKYTLEGSVAVDVTASDDYVRVAISDSGLGIPAEDLPHLFQKFYRVDNSDTREIGGTGLGLYLCRKLIEAMDGRIWVESEYKKGSTFYIEIPRMDRLKATELMEREALATHAGAVPSADTTIVAAELGTVETAPVVTPPPTPVATPTPVPTAAETGIPEPILATDAPVNSLAAEPIQFEDPEPRRFGAVAYTPTVATPDPVAAAPTPEQAAPSPAQPTTVTTPAPAAPTRAAPRPERANIPLSSLERNPSQYIAPRPEQPK